MNNDSPAVNALHDYPLDGMIGPNYVFSQNASKRIEATSLKYGTDHAYFRESSHLYATRSYIRTIKASHSIAIYLSLCDTPIEFIVKGVRIKATAAVFKPLVARHVTDRGFGFVCAMLSPTHSLYRQFSTAETESVIVLDRLKFAPLNKIILKAFHGDLGLKEGMSLFSQIVDLAADEFPSPPPLDARIAAVVQLLRHNAMLPLDDLATAVGLSYHRLSHLFSSCVGLPLRSYELSLKIQRAWRLIARGHSIREIAAKAGFNDVSHLCHVFQSTYGTSITSQLRSVTFKGGEKMYRRGAVKVYESQ